VAACLEEAQEPPPGSSPRRSDDGLQRGLPVPQYGIRTLHTREPRQLSPPGPLSSPRTQKFAFQWSGSRSGCRTL